jgi:hypothetical protein
VELATTVPLSDVDRTLAEIQDLTVPAKTDDPVCEMVRLRADNAEDLAALDTLQSHLPATDQPVLLSLHPSPKHPRRRAFPQDARRFRAFHRDVMLDRHRDA